MTNLTSNGRPSAIVGARTGNRNYSNKNFNILNHDDEDKRYRHIVEDLTEMVCRFSPDFKISFANQAFCHFMKKDRSGISNFKFLSILSEEEKKQFQKSILALTFESPVLVWDQSVKMNGEAKFYRFTVKAIFKRSGELLEYQASCHDMTGLKIREHDLSTSYSMSRALFEHASEPILLIEASSGMIQNANLKARKLIGCSLEEVRLMHYFEIHPVNERARYEKFFRSMVQNSTESVLNCAELIDASGNVIPVEISGSKIKCDESCLVQLIIRDIKARVKDDQDFQRQSELLKLESKMLQAKAALFDDAGESMVVHNLDGSIIDWNNASEQIYGWNKASAIGKNIHELLRTQLPDSLDDVKNILLKDGKWSGEIVHTTRAGKILNIFSRWTLLRDETFSGFVILEINSDISEKSYINLRDKYIHLRKSIENRTARILDIDKQLQNEIEKHKRARAELIRAEEKHYTILESLEYGYFEADLKGNMKYVNGAFAKLTGLGKSRLSGMHYRQIMTKEDSEVLHKIFNRVYSTSNPRRNLVLNILNRNGSAQPVDLSITLIKDPQGLPIYFCGIAHPSLVNENGYSVDELKIAEDALRKSEDMYKTIFENTGTAMLIIEEDTLISLVNNELEDITGYSKGEIINKKSWKDFIVEGEIPRLYGYHKSRRVNPQSAPREYETRIKIKNGQVRDIYIKTDMIPGTKRSIASVVDITEYKKTQLELQRRREELLLKNIELSEINSECQALLKRREEDRIELEKKILKNIRELVLPYLEKLKSNNLDNPKSYLEMLEKNLNQIISPLVNNITNKFPNLTAREIQIINFIIEDKTTKDMSDLLGVSPKAIEFHRNSIRRKLGLRGEKANLKSYLRTLVNAPPGFAENTINT